MVWLFYRYTTRELYGVKHRDVEIACATTRIARRDLEQEGWHWFMDDPFALEADIEAARQADIKKWLGMEGAD
jgi:hypothetical protein